MGAIYQGRKFTAQSCYEKDPWQLYFESCWLSPFSSKLILGVYISGIFSYLGMLFSYPKIQRKFPGSCSPCQASGAYGNMGHKSKYKKNNTKVWGNLLNIRYWRARCHLRLDFRTARRLKPWLNCLLWLFLWHQGWLSPALKSPWSREQIQFCRHISGWSAFLDGRDRQREGTEGTEGHPVHSKRICQQQKIMACSYTDSFALSAKGGIFEVGQFSHL